MSDRTVGQRALARRCSPISLGNAAGSTGAGAMVWVIFAVALLSGCATTSNKQAADTSPEYRITGGIGLVIGPQVTPIAVRGPDREAAANLESNAKAKSELVSKGIGVTAFTILVAPFAILAPLYPPAIQLAVLPFMAADATSKVGQEANRLKLVAAKARLDAACSEELAAAHPAFAEHVVRTLSGASLRQSIEDEMLDSLKERANEPVTPLGAPRPEEGWEPKGFLKDAEERHLPTVIEIEIQSLDLRGESTNHVYADCRYKIMTSLYLAVWNVGERRAVFLTGARTVDATLPFDSGDIAAVLDHPEEFRLRLAGKIRDAVVPILNTPALKFANATPGP